MPHQWLERTSIRYFTQPALHLAGADVSYGELEQRVSRIGCSLRGVGVEPGAVVAVSCASHWHTALLLHTTLRLGAVLLPLDPAMEAGRRSALLQQCGCNFLLADRVITNLPDGVRPLLLDTILRGELLDTAADRSLASAIQLIIATSGTTGEPKGVMLSAANLAAAVAASRQRLGLQTDDCWLNCLPLFHIAGASILYRCLEARSSVLLHDRFDAAKVWVDIERHGVTHISLVPAMLSKLLDSAAGTLPPATLRVALIGGGVLDPVLAERAQSSGWPICVSYGMSETASQLATTCGKQAGLEAGLVGEPLDGFEISLTDGDSGRIRVRGPAVMVGYANPTQRPRIGLQADGWFETGDLGEWDATGALRILGRADGILISGGNNIHPGEVERALLSCPGIEAVAVSGRPDAVWGVVLVAEYVGVAAAEEVEAWARSNIPTTIRPREFVRVQALSVGASDG